MQPQGQSPKQPILPTSSNHHKTPDQDIEKHTILSTPSFEWELFPGFLKKVLYLFFWLWHKDKVNRTNGSGDKTRKA